jgi:aerobic carbon-monoxide dehydrogenase medium subunit
VKPAPFDYHAPERVEGVLEMIADQDREMRVLAGGQSLVPMMNFRLARPDGLVDLNRVRELRYVRVEGDGSLAIGAGARQVDALRNPGLAEGWPIVIAALEQIGHPQIRSRGTVCGSIAHNDPAAELPAVAVALDAQMTVRSANGEREIGAEEFFVSYFETALEPGELLSEVSFPAPEPGTGWAFGELARRRGDFALIGVAALVRRRGDVAASPRIVLFGAGERPVRCSAAEATLDGRPPEPDVVREAAERARDEIAPLDDVHASADYRRELATVLVGRAVRQAWERCA